MSDSGSSDKNDPKASDDLDAFEEDSKMEEIFPWQVKFNELCRASVGSKNMKMLENLLTVYLQKGSKTIQDCYMKPNRAGKLKKCMSDALVFFHLFYQDIKESFENSTYLEKMTELMAMYLNIEIKASRRRKEHTKKVVCRLTSALNNFLDHSENHILDAIIRAKFINKNYREICSPVLGKLLTSLRVYPMNDTLYVRYLLVFKLWKKVVADADERKNINKIAISNLPAPSNFMERYKRFNNVLPRVPNSMNVTTFYMQAKFNLKTACQAFMKISKDPQQPIINDTPLFFEGRLSSSQSTFSGKANAFECGVSRNLMNDIWSIAEPASSKKSDAAKKKAKDKPNKNGKKRTKDWLDKELRKNSKNKPVIFGNVNRNILSTNVVPQADNGEISVLAKEPLAVAVAIALAAKPATVETLTALDAANVQEVSGGLPPQAVPIVPQPPPTETKPLLNTLTPQLEPEDTKPLILQNSTSAISPAVQGDVPRIQLTPPAEDKPKKETSSVGQYAISCRKFEDSTGVGANLFSGQVQEEPIRIPILEATDTHVEEPDNRKVAKTMGTSQPTEIVKPRDLRELIEDKSSPKEVLPSIADPEYMDDDQDVINEVTIATSELDISTGENNVELPVYLQCQKEVVVETVEQPSPGDSEASSRNEEDQLPRVVEFHSEFTPPSGGDTPQNCFAAPSRSSEAEQFVVEQLPARDNFKFAVPSPLGLVQEQHVYVDMREEVKPEIIPPPEDMSYPKEAPPIDEVVPDWNQLPFGFFQTGNNSDLFLEAMDMRSFELDPVVDPRVIDPRMLEEPGPSVIKRRASEEFQSYPRMFMDSSLHRTRVESVLPPQEFLAEDFPAYTSASEQFSYYNARDLYGNYNPHAFFEEPLSQTVSRGLSNRRQILATSAETEVPPSPCNTVGYGSSSSNSSNNSILPACDKDNVDRYSRTPRTPSNSNNNYYRETDSHKSQDHNPSLRKTHEPNPTPRTGSILKHSSTYNLEKLSQKNPHRKTPHPVSTQPHPSLVQPHPSSVQPHPSSVQPHPSSAQPHPSLVQPHPPAVQQERRNVGYSSNSANSTAVDCKVQLSHLRSEETTPPTRSGPRAGTLFSDTGMPLRHAVVPLRHAVMPLRPAGVSHYLGLGVRVGLPIPSIPYTPRHDTKCTCDDCFSDVQRRLFSAHENIPSALVQNFHPSRLKTRADELKHEDDQILKTIEDSLRGDSTQENAQILDGGASEVETRCKTEPLSSLPPKKRHKLNNDQPESTPSEISRSFPNFGLRPMMSILSLQEPVATNNPRPLQESNGNHVKVDYSSTKPNVPPIVETNQLQQPNNNINIIKPVHAIPTSTAVYPSQHMDDSEINSRKRDEVIANYWKKTPHKKPVNGDAKSNSEPEKEPVVTSDRQYKPTQPSRTYPAPTKSHSNVNYAEPTENIRRQFKTPAQLKELPLNRDAHLCFPYSCHVHTLGVWNQTTAESMILHRESYVPQPPSMYRMTDPAKPTSSDHKSERKRSSGSQKRSANSSTKRTRCSNRKSQSGSATGDASDSKRKRKDNSR